MEITLEIEVMLSYLSYFMLNGITIFCPVGLEADVSCEISHRKKGEVHFTSPKHMQYAHCQMYNFFMPLTFTNHSAYENKLSLIFKSIYNIFPIYDLHYYYYYSSNNLSDQLLKNFCLQKIPNFYLVLG